MHYDEWCQPQLSPDENWIALNLAYDTNLWLYKFGTGWLPPLISMKGCQGGAVWEPDGRHVAFYSLGADSPPDVYWRLWNNGDTPELLYKTESSEQPTSFSPDGKHLALTVHHVPETGLARTSDIWILEIATREATQWTHTQQCSEWGAAFSHGGKWIAYTSDEIGQNEVYVRQFPDGDAERVSIGGGSEVMWGPDGEKLELFYRDDKQFISAQIQTEPQFKVVHREALFDDVYIRARFPGHRNYDISKDDERFLMIKQVDEQPAPVTHLNVVLNWFEEVKRLAPPGKH
jgi:Tol biopolymer transport system component